MNTVEAANTLNEIQRASFKMADRWAEGLGLEYAGVDLSAPMLYELTTIFNRQLVTFYFPPEAEAQEMEGKEAIDDGQLEPVANEAAAN